MEPLEHRNLLAGTLTITALQGPDTLSAAVPAATEGAAANPSVNAAFTDTNAVAPANLTVTVNYGDGTPISTNQGAGADPNLIITQVGGPAGITYTVTDQHTFPEESGSTVPPFAFTLTLTVTENANAANHDTRTTTAQVLDAPLVNGDPVNPVSAGVTTGGNTGNATSAAQAETNFKAAIGGSKNTATAPQSGGFRVITWDGVKTDGTDAVAGPGSTVPIPAGSTHTVGIPLDRFQGSGVFFGAVYAVSNDGFVDVNPNVGGASPLFPAFSPPSVFAMFNDNGIDFKFVAPSPTNTALVPAVARGFGAIFLNVRHAGSTTIQYFHGAHLLDTVTVPTNATVGAAVFAGELFTQPIVTNVLLTLGDGVIFKFDGTTVTSGGANTATNNLVAVDDWVFPEPVPSANGFPIVSGPGGTSNAVATVSAVAGQAFSGVVATFSDLDPNGNARDYTATINWGDGHLTNGTIAADGAGGFSVTGTNTYALVGRFPISVDVADFGGGPGLGGSSPTQSVTNTANVTAGDQNHRFVAQVFADLLGRTVDPNGLAFFGGLLDGGILNRAQVVQDIEASPEFRVVEVNAAYQAILNRQADPAGLNAFVQFLSQGGTVEQMKEGLFSSPEFFNLSQTANTSLPAGNQRFVDLVFVDVLGRHADAAGLAALNNQLNSGVSRATVAAEILFSQEGEQDLVNSFYLKFLHRQADSAGLNHFVGVLQHGGRDEDVILALVASDEYFGMV